MLSALVILILYLYIHALTDRRSLSSSTLCFPLQLSLDQANATLCSVDKSGTSVNNASFYCGPFLILAAQDNNDEPDKNLQEKEVDHD